MDEPLFYGRMYRRLIEAVPGMIAGVVVLPHPAGAGPGQWFREGVYRWRFWGPKGFFSAAVQLLWAKFRATGNVMQAARAAGIDVWHEAELQGVLEKLRERKVEVVLASIACRVPNEGLALARRGWVNTHCGPLPRYGGFDAPFWCLYNNEPTLAVTLHYMAQGIDEGPIIAQRSIPAGNQTYFQLLHRLFDLAYEMHKNCLTGSWPQLADAAPQDLARRTYFGKPSVEKGRQFRRRGGRFA